VVFVTRPVRAKGKLCFALSSVGRTDRLRACLESLAELAGDNCVVGVCDQSRDGSVTALAATVLHGKPWFGTTSGPGLSAGRNAIIAAAPNDVTHFSFPNDTSSFPTDFVARVLSFASFDVLVASYVNSGSVRYRFRAGMRPLTRRNVWRALEPATILSAAFIERFGSFDEGLGTGSAGPFQSGEGTDLLLRAVPSAVETAWVPDLCVFGVVEGHGLTLAQLYAKRRGYGRGYGFLLRRHEFSWGFRVKALIAPLAKGLLGFRLTSFRIGLETALGRLEGLKAGKR
jgi:hypothetical protein